MKLFNLAALIVMVSVPLLLLRKDKQKPAESVESDRIFEQELSTE